MLFKNGPEFFSFSLAIFIFARLLQKKIIPETKFTQQIYFQNVKLEWDFESKSQRLFKYGVGFEILPGLV